MHLLRYLRAGERRPGAADTDAERLFHSPEAEKIKDEIVAVGRKLWQRQYVDGNGGNISYRLGPNAVLCTPTLSARPTSRPKTCAWWISTATSLPAAGRAPAKF